MLKMFQHGESAFGEGGLSCGCCEEHSRSPENVIIPYSEKLDNYVDNRIVMKVKKMRSKIVKKHWKH